MYIGKTLKNETSGQLGTNHSCMKGINVYSNEGPSLLKGGIITKVQK
jgi:hypothetical protein